MNRILYSLLIAVTFTTNIVPLTESSTLLTHKETGKRVLLLGDVHEGNMKEEIDNASKSEKTKALAQATLALFRTVKSKQRKELTTFAHTMLASDNKQDGQTIVMSEIDTDILKSVCTKDIFQTPQTVYVLPQVLMNHLGTSKAAQEEKFNTEKFMSPLDIGIKSFFQVTHNLHFVAADSFRNNNLDTLLRMMAHDKDLSSLKKQLPTHLAHITIGNLRKDLLESHAIFAKFDINNVYTEKLLAIIDESLHAGTLSELDLIIDVGIPLQQGNPVKAKALMDDLSEFAARKCDFELSYYITSLENNAEIKHFIINAGADHTDFIKTRLVKNGFHVTEESDTANCLNFEKAPHEEVLDIISKGLNVLHQKSPHSLLPKLFQA